MLLSGIVHDLPSTSVHQLPGHQTAQSRQGWRQQDADQPASHFKRGAVRHRQRQRQRTLSKSLHKLQASMQHTNGTLSAGITGTYMFSHW